MPEPGRWIDAEDAELYYWPDLFAAEAPAWLAQLTATLDWQREVVRIGGREHLARRLTAFYGDRGVRYRYSGTTREAPGWTPLLAHIRERVESASGDRFNSVLVNRYRDGDDRMGWHADDEPELGRNPAIASVSLGAVRTFVLRHRRRHSQQVRIELADGSLLLMAGSTQHNWQHALPVRRRVRAARINLTFRRVIAAG